MVGGSGGGEAAPGVGGAEIGEEAGGIFVEVEEGLGTAIEDAALSLGKAFEEPKFDEKRLDGVEGGGGGVFHRGDRRRWSSGCASGGLGVVDKVSVRLVEPRPGRASWAGTRWLVRGDPRRAVGDR